MSLNTNRPLPVRPVVYSDESPGSVLLRASESNGWYSLGKMIAALGFGYSGTANYQIRSHILNNKTIWPRICKQTKIKNRAAVNYLSGSTSVLRLQKPAICPKCLLEKKYLPRSWDYQYITCCTRHKINLVHTCYLCNADLRWNRQTINICQCGADLSKSPVTLASESAITLSQYIENLLENNHSKKLVHVIETYNLLKQFFPLINKPKDHEYLLSKSIHFTEQTEEYAIEITRRVVAAVQNNWQDPSISLLPFLESQSIKIRNMGTNILDDLTNRGIRAKSVTLADFKKEPLLAEKLMAEREGIRKKCNFFTS